MRPALIPLYWFPEKTTDIRRGIRERWIWPVEGWRHLDQAVAIGRGVASQPAFEDDPVFKLDWPQYCRYIPFLPASDTEFLLPQDYNWYAISNRVEELIVKKTIALKFNPPKIRKSTKRWLLELKEQQGSRTDRFHETLSDPFRLLAWAYEQLIATAVENRMTGETLTWLSVMAFAIRGVGRMPMCNLCCRLRPPESEFCDVHSQSKTNSNGTASDKARQYQLGKLVAEHLDWPDSRPSLFAPTSHPHLIASVLWGDRPRWPGQLRSDIVLSLLGSPNVLRIVGEDSLGLQPMPLLARLRERLDRQEWECEVWPDKIRYCETWFAAARAVDQVRWEHCA